MGLLFWPRGGSAQVARYLARALQVRGTAVQLAVGSLGDPGDHGHAQTFFGDGCSISPLHYDDAIAEWRSGADPMDAAVPLHPSFEAKPGVPDRVMTSVSKEQLAHATDVWHRHLSSSPGFADADVLHIHHLSVVQLAARAVAPRTPLVTHLHGTELKLLDEITRGTPGIADQPHAAATLALLRAAAVESDAVIVNSPHDHAEALRLLAIDPETTFELTNGVDVSQFAPRMSPPQRAARALEALARR